MKHILKIWIIAYLHDRATLFSLNFVGFLYFLFIYCASLTQMLKFRVSYDLCYSKCV